MSIKTTIFTNIFISVCNPGGAATPPPPQKQNKKLRPKPETLNVFFDALYEKTAGLENLEVFQQKNKEMARSFAG